MRILLVALNARYVHTNLAVRYLRGSLLEQSEADWEVMIREFSINEHLAKIAADIFEEKPDIIGFSCYIWNVRLVLGLVRRLRLVLPKAYLLAGGPEVSFDSEYLLADYPELDAVVCGEGETAFPALIRVWSAGEDPRNVPGIVWRRRGQSGRKEDDIIINNGPGTYYTDLNNLPNPYGFQEDLRGRLVYVETSRGCPYNCQFCLSSTYQGIRFLEPERFRPILQRLLASGAGTIKFVDRTFNACKQHAFRILDIFREESQRFSADHQEGQSFWPRAHCEMAGELLDKEWLDYLQTFPKGMIQLEIGVQSTHRPTLNAVQRLQQFAVWKDRVVFLQQACHIPVHLDLIAGLPLEGFQEFRSSFNETFSVRPDNLQLGFLKVLKGSGIREKSKDYGLKYAPDPPYTILQTRELTHAKILELARVEDILEKYYNSGKFRFSLELIMLEWPSPFDFFYSFSTFLKQGGWFRREWDNKALFAGLWQFLARQAGENHNFVDPAVWREAIRFDYFLMAKPGLVPDFLEPDVKPDRRNRDYKKMQHEIWDQSSWSKLISGAEKLDRRQWSRATAVEYFLFDVPQARSIVKTGGEAGVWYLFYYGDREKKYFKYEGI